MRISWNKQVWLCKLVILAHRQPQSNHWEWALTFSSANLKVWSLFLFLLSTNISRWWGSTIFRLLQSSVSQSNYKINIEEFISVTESKGDEILTMNGRFNRIILSWCQQSTKQNHYITFMSPQSQKSLSWSQRLWLIKLWLIFLREQLNGNWRKFRGKLTTQVRCTLKDEKHCTIH